MSFAQQKKTDVSKSGEISGNTPADRRR